MAEEIIKEFWKNSHFENMRADFPLRHQNSLRQNTPEMMHFQTWTKNIFTINVPKWLFFWLNVVCVVSRWYFDQVLGHKISKSQLLIQWLNISKTNKLIFHQSKFLPPQKKTSSHIFKMLIFSKFFGDFMNQLIN